MINQFSYSHRLRNNFCTLMKLNCTFAFSSGQFITISYSSSYYSQFTDLQWINNTRAWILMAPCDF